MRLYEINNDRSWMIFVLILFFEYFNNRISERKINEKGVNNCFFKFFLNTA